MSDKTHWFSHADIADMIAISESTPGAIGINMSTFAGFKTAGYLGGVVATVGLATPSLIIILIISGFLVKFQKSRHVQNALYGLRPASIAMITAAGLNVAKVSLINLSAFMETHRITDLFIFQSDHSGYRHLCRTENISENSPGRLYRFLCSSRHCLPFLRSMTFKNHLQTSTQPMAPEIFSSSSTVSFTALWSLPAAG